MVRITARQAFTRAKTRREKGKIDTNKALVEARRRYVRQLADVGIEFQGASQLSQLAQPSTSEEATTKGRGRKPIQHHQQPGTKKITDYFCKTRTLEFNPRVKQPLKTSSSFDPNGIECVTIYDSDNEACVGNNNMDIQNDNVLNTPQRSTSYDSAGNSFWETSSDSNNSNQVQLGSRQPSTEDFKPLVAKLDISNLGVSFEDLKLKVKVNEDVEIVDMLPPIPLRKHEIYELEDDENEQS